jgi:hypothetical protein
VHGCGGAGVCLAIGPAGWAVLAIGAAIVGIWMLFRAEDAKDDDLEKWIKHSCLGKANTDKTYVDARTETEAFEKLWQIPVGVDIKWGKGLLGGHIDINIVAPALSDAWVSYSLQIVRDKEKPLLITEDRAVSGNALSRTSFDEQLKRYQPMTGSLYTASESSIDWGLTYEDFSLQIKTVNVTLKYWPNRKTNPSTILPTAAGKLFSMSINDV